MKNIVDSSENYLLILKIRNGNESLFEQIIQLGNDIF